MTNKNVEIDDIWRLYRREWVIVHTIDGTLDHEHIVAAAPVFEAACQWAKDNVVGRVRDEDVNIQLNTDNDTRAWAHVRVFKETLKGEFKQRSNAEVFASINNFDEYTIVPRNSPADHDIRNYGVTKL